jgi:hypothetical protein
MCAPVGGENCALEAKLGVWKKKLYLFLKFFIYE